MKLVLITRLDGGSMWLNPYDFRSVAPSEKKTATGTASVITFRNGDMLLVATSLESIIAQIIQRANYDSDAR